jgi:hypothetical protein
MRLGQSSSDPQSVESALGADGDGVYVSPTSSLTGLSLLDRLHIDGNPLNNKENIADEGRGGISTQGASSRYARDCKRSGE